MAQPRNQSGTARSRPAPEPARAPGVAQQVGGLIGLPVVMARQVLPGRELPVYLGVGALAVAGAIEWPFAVAAGLGYAALRRWGPLGPPSA